MTTEGNLSVRVQQLFGKGQVVATGAWSRRCHALWPTAADID